MNGGWSPSTAGCWHLYVRGWRYCGAAGSRVPGRLYPEAPALARVCRTCAGEAARRERLRRALEPERPSLGLDHPYVLAAVVPPHEAPRGASLRLADGRRRLDLPAPGTRVLVVLLVDPADADRLGLEPTAT